MIMGKVNARRVFTLKELRIMSKLTIDQIVAEMGISKVTLHAWEKGTTAIPLPRLNTLLQLYKATSDDLDWEQTLQDIERYK